MKDFFELSDGVKLLIPEEVEVRRILLPDLEALSPKELEGMISNFVEAEGFGRDPFVWHPVPGGIEVFVCRQVPEGLKDVDGPVVVPYSITRPLLENTDLSMVVLRLPDGRFVLHAASKGETFFYETFGPDMDVQQVLEQLKVSKGNRDAHVLILEEIPATSFSANLFLKKGSRLFKYLRYCAIAVLIVLSLIVARDLFEVKRLTKSTSQLTRQYQQMLNTRLELERLVQGERKKGKILQQIPEVLKIPWDPYGEMRFLSELASRTKAWVREYEMRRPHGLSYLRIAVYGTDPREIKGKAEALVEELWKKKRLKLRGSGVEVYGQNILLTLDVRQEGLDEALQGSTTDSGGSSRPFGTRAERVSAPAPEARRERAGEAHPAGEDARRQVQIRARGSEEGGFLLSFGRRIARIVSAGTALAAPAGPERLPGTSGRSTADSRRTDPGADRASRFSTSGGSNHKADAYLPPPDPDPAQLRREGRTPSLPPPPAWLSTADSSIADFTAPPPFLRAGQEPTLEQRESVPGLGLLPNLESFLAEHKVQRKEGSSEEKPKAVAAFGSRVLVLTSQGLVVKPAKEAPPLFACPQPWKVEVRPWQ